MKLIQTILNKFWNESLIKHRSEILILSIRWLVSDESLLYVNLLTMLFLNHFSSKLCEGLKNTNRSYINIFALSLSVTSSDMYGIDKAIEMSFEGFKNKFVNEVVRSRLEVSRWFNQLADGRLKITTVNKKAARACVNSKCLDIKNSYYFRNILMIEETFSISFFR